MLLVNALSDCVDNDEDSSFYMKSHPDQAVRRGSFSGQQSVKSKKLGQVIVRLLPILEIRPHMASTFIFTYANETGFLI